MLHTITAHLRRHTVAYLALFVALSGTSYAAAEPGPPREPGAPTEPGAPREPGAPNLGGESGNVAARARTTSPVSARHGGSTDVPLTGGSWKQPTGELQLLAGTMVVSTPANCTGGFGNALTLSVDGQVTTFAPVLTAPGAGATTVTIPFAVGTLGEPDRDASHKLTAKFANSCTKDGEDYAIKAVQVNVLKFH